MKPYVRGGGQAPHKRGISVRCPATNSVIYMCNSYSCNRKSGLQFAQKTKKRNRVAAAAYRDAHGTRSFAILTKKIFDKPMEILVRHT
jgi:hypothetical protein